MLLFKFYGNICPCKLVLLVLIHCTCSRLHCDPMLPPRMKSPGWGTVNSSMLTTKWRRLPERDSYESCYHLNVPRLYRVTCFFGRLSWDYRSNNLSFDGRWFLQEQTDICRKDWNSKLFLSFPFLMSVALICGSVDLTDTIKRRNIIFCPKVVHTAYLSSLAKSFKHMTFFFFLPPTPPTTKPLCYHFHFVHGCERFKLFSLPVPCEPIIPWPLTEGLVRRRSRPLLHPRRRNGLLWL